MWCVGLKGTYDLASTTAHETVCCLVLSVLVSVVSDAVCLLAAKDALRRSRLSSEAF